MIEREPSDVRSVARPPQRLAPFNAAGILGPADVHAARVICRLTGENRDDVLLAIALTVRAPRFGHVCADLATVADTVAPDDDATVPTDALAWPDLADWVELVRSSPAVAIGTPDRDGEPTLFDAVSAGHQPLTLVDTRLYLDRYWRYERRVATELERRAQLAEARVDDRALAAILDRLFPGVEDDDRQRVAAETGVRRRVAVIAGGPGTGKTTTVARLLATLHEVAEVGGARAPRVGLAAPTGKAADRLTVAIHDAAGELDTSHEVRDRLRGSTATTLHRLLGWNPGNPTRFRHRAEDPLPHDVIVVDETSMVSLALMAKLLDALREDARIVLVGDPDQLQSVEAGTVFGDIVGPAATAGAGGSDPERPVRASDGARTAAAPAEPHGAIAAGIVVLTRVHRFREDSGIAALATAARSGDADTAVDVLRGGYDDLTWLDAPGDADRSADHLGTVHDAVCGAGGAVVRAAMAGRVDEALAHLHELRVLCGHRRGPAGVSGWVPLIESWLTAAAPGFAPHRTWHEGRPVLVTSNDRRLGLWNGDQGVTVVGDDDRLVVAFPGPDGARLFRPTRLEDVETVHAMTIHKSQGSQFGHVVVVLPDPTSRVLTRELLYTAVTRAQQRLTVLGTEASVRAGVERGVARNSGLRELLWG
ncbi:MAG: exodeoxyribonuclease V subunit alpha [Actinobacteria bacterium]|nr:exodeoxyribonuclease V subunit alpha [Actinomycetota bacterium]